MREEWIDLFGNKHRPCDCQMCVYGRKVTNVLHRGDVQEMKDTINELMEAQVNIQFDLSYLECIFSGSWPSAVEQLEEALERAKNHPNRVLEQEEKRQWSMDKV